MRVNGVSEYVAVVASLMNEYISDLAQFWSNTSPLSSSCTASIHMKAGYAASPSDVPMISCRVLTVKSVN